MNESGELVLTYSDGNSANLGLVIGKDGADGAKGDKGDQGENGDKGDTGAAGADGKDGTDGQNGKDGISVLSAEINSDGELVLSYSNGQRSNLGNVIGAAGKDGKDGIDGAKGDKGDTGEAGADGKDGANGQNGKNGKDGISIIKSEINGKGELVITYSDNTMANLGVVVGANGKDGKDGLNGTDGKDGADGDKGDKGDQGEKGETGATGADGKDGTNGTDGRDGVGIANVNITTDGNLTVTLTNGAALSLGNIKGADGIGITKSEINADGHLVLTYSDGNSADLGKIVGANGTNGADGQDGVGISDVKILTDGTLTITLSDGSTKSLGNIKGEKGDAGEKGEKGDTGENGKDGRGIAKTELVNGELIITYTDGTSDNLGSINAETTDINYVLLSDGTYGITASKVTKYCDEIFIPAEHNGKPVTKILDYTFEKCYSLRKVVIPDTVTYIGSQSFYYCLNLKEIILPSNLTYIGKEAFAATSITSITIPQSVKFIGENALNRSIYSGTGNSSIEKIYFEKTSGWYCDTASFDKFGIDMSDASLMGEIYHGKTYVTPGSGGKLSYTFSGSHEWKNN